VALSENDKMLPYACCNIIKIDECVVPFDIDFLIRKYATEHLFYQFLQLLTFKKSIIGTIIKGLSAVK
jgi:hypothetical protein